jgi:nucleoid-associated protein YgaU
MSVATDFAPVVPVPERVRLGRVPSKGAATVLPFRLPISPTRPPAASPKAAEPAAQPAPPREVSLREAAGTVPHWYPVHPVRVSPVRRPVAAIRSGPVRLTRRGYAAAGVLVASLLGGMLWLAHLSAADGAVAPVRAPGVVTVHDGDTLWSIASRVAPQRDPRLVVAELEKVNHLSCPILQPGQRLRTH